MQDAEVLALVFMDALDLYVEDCRRVDQDAGAFLDQGCERGFVGAFDGTLCGAEVGVFGPRLEAPPLAQIADPVVANARADAVGKARIG